jgi:hypothetical protein
MTGGFANLLPGPPPGAGRSLAQRWIRTQLRFPDAKIGAIKSANQMK